MHDASQEPNPDHGDRRLGLGETDVLALASPRAVIERTHHREQSVERAQGVGIRVLGHGALASGESGQLAQAGQRLDVRPPGDVSVVGTPIAVAGGADHDDVRLHAAKLGVAEAELVHHAGAVVLDHHVAGCDETP